MYRPSATSQKSTPSASRLRIWLVLCALLVTGCHSLGHTCGQPARSWSRCGHRHCAAVREAGWNLWAAEHLQSGDIVFVLGESRILLGLVNFSKLSTDIAGSRFSHVGLVSREADQVEVYDIVAEGARRMTFGAFMNDGRVWTVAVKRLQPEYQSAVPAAIEYCQTVYADRRQFDSDFRLDNDRLYCSEMLELAFQHAGLSLADPVPMCSLPHFDRLREPTKRLIHIATKIDFAQPIYLPGNDQIGIWACPYLDLILPPMDPATPPSAGALMASASGRNSESADPAETEPAAPTLPAPLQTRQAAAPSGRLDGRR